MGSNAIENQRCPECGVGRLVLTRTGLACTAASWICGYHEPTGDRAPAPYRLPVYLVRKTIADDLPPEKDSKLIGFVLSNFPFSRSYQGCWGAIHESPDPEDSGFYPVYSLIMCGIGNLHGLSWLPIVSEGDDS
jgi:hypothetical protein